jgi:hypothetical protein
METNVGGLDEGIRITLGPLLLVLSVASVQESVRIRPSVTAVAGAVGAVLTVTGLARKCPANSAMGRDTSRSASELGETAQEVRERALQ